MATNQQRLDALKTHLSSIAEQTSKAHAEIVNKIDALRNQESNLDFSGLDQTVARLGVVAEALDGIVPDEIDAEDPSEPVEPAAPETGSEEPVADEPAEEPAPVPSDSPAEPVSRSKRK